MTLISLIIYIAYRNFRTLVEIICGAVGQIAGWSKMIGRMREDSTCDNCEVCTPLARKKAYEGDPARTFDFILWHKRFIPMELLIDPQWTIYCAGKEWIYFVYSWRSMRDYQSRKVPFVYIQQFVDAELVARMSIAQFCRFSNMLGLPKPKVVYLCTMPRAGSTLLTSMLQASDRLIALSEPDIFTNLAMWKEMDQFDQATLCGLVKTSFCKICHEFSNTDVVIIKPQPSGAIMVSEIYATLPEHVQHLFLYRKTVDAAMKSIERLLTVDGRIWDIINVTKISDAMAVQLIGFYRYQAKLFVQFRPKTVLDYSYLVFVGPFVWFLGHRKRGIPIYFTRFEDIVGNSRPSMKRLFGHLGVLTPENEDSILTNALNALNVDSQADTYLSKENIAKVPFTSLSAQIRVKFDERNKQLGLPTMFVDGSVPDFD